MGSVLAIRRSGEGDFVPLVVTPQTMSYDIYDLDGEAGSGRAQDGTMFRDRVAVKRKLNCTWPPLTSAQLSALLSRVVDEFFEIRYPDGLTGTVQTMIVYVGDRSAPMYRYFEDSDTALWEGLSMNFIER